MTWTGDPSSRSGSLTTSLKRIPRTPPRAKLPSRNPPEKSNGRKAGESSTYFLRVYQQSVDDPTRWMEQDYWEEIYETASNAIQCMVDLTLDWEGFWEEVSLWEYMEGSVWLSNLSGCNAVFLFSENSDSGYDYIQDTEGWGDEADSGSALPYGALVCMEGDVVDCMHDLWHSVVCSDQKRLIAAASMQEQGNWNHNRRYRCGR